MPLDQPTDRKAKIAEILRLAQAIKAKRAQSNQEGGEDEPTITSFLDVLSGRPTGRNFRMAKDVAGAFTSVGETASEGARQITSGENPVAGTGKLVLALGQGVAAPFAAADRVLREFPVVGKPLAEGIAKPFEIAGGAVREGEKLIDVGLQKAGVPENVRNLGMDPKKAAEAAATLSAVNQMAAQFAVPVSGKKMGGKLAGGIIKGQEAAARPIFKPRTTEPVDYVAPESRQLYPPRNQRFVQRPGSPPIDIKAGVPTRPVPPLLPENLPLRKPGLEPTRTFEVTPEGGARAVKSTPAPLTNRIDKALADVPANTKARIKRKLAAKEKLSVGEKNILTQRDPEIFDYVYEKKLPPGVPLSFEKTPAGEQGSFAQLEQAKTPERKPSGLSYESQVEGTMFEKPKAPPPPQEEMFGAEKMAWEMTRDQYLAKRPQQSATPVERSNKDYAGQHEAPMSDSGSPIWDLTANGTYPKDVYGPSGKLYYGTGDELLDGEAYSTISAYKNKPNSNITVFRAVPKNIKGSGEKLIQPGDWITISRKYAKEHGSSALSGDFRIVSKRVKARDIFTEGDSWLEWGYDPQPENMSARHRTFVVRALRAGKPVPPEVLKDYPDLTKPSPGEKVTDPAQIQEIRNSIAEGQLILRAGTSHGRKLSPEELLNVRRQVERAQAKIGESRIEGKSVDAKITDVTPEGYGPTWNDAVSESGKRLKKTGLSPDKPQGTLSAGLDPSLLVDPKKVKYVIDPIIKKALTDARKMIVDGRLKPEQFPFEVRSTINTLLTEHPDFRGLTGPQKRAIFNHVKEATKDLVYNPVAGNFQTQEGRKFREEMRKAQGGGLTPAPIEGGRIISEPMKRELTDPNAIYQDGIMKFAARQASTLGEYVKKQGPSGESLAQSINRDYRKSAQWAGRLEQDYRAAVKHLSAQEFDEFVSLSDEGGTTRNANVANALNVWDKIRHEISDRAQRSELDMAVFDRAKGDFIKIPFRPRENFFPHEFDITELKKAANREKYLERISQRYKVPKSEAEWIFNKWIRSRIEVRYGHLEHARDFDIGGWKRSKDVIPAYIERATRRITQSEIYGKDYAIAQNYIEQILNSGGDYKAAQTLFDRVVGRENYDKTWTAIQRNINSWQVATKLTLLSVLNPTQVNNAGLVGGVKSLGRQLFRQFGNYKEMQAFADRAGSILESTLRMHQREALSLDGIGSKMMKLTGVTAEERWLRTLSTNIIADSFKREAKNLSNPRSFAEMQRKINYLNLSKDIDLAKVRERGSFTDQELLDIGYEGARKTQFLGRPQDLPPLISNQNLKLFTQFKSFITQQTVLMKDAVLKEAAHGNLKPLLYVLTMFPLAGEAALDLKSFIQQRDRPDNYAMRGLEDMMAVGAFGMAADMLRQAARDPQGLMAWFAGPTMSDVSEFGYGVGQAVEGKPKPLLRFGAKNIPIPIIQQTALDALRTKKKTPRGITQ